MNILPEVQDFLNSPLRNEWITVVTPRTKIHIYVRKAHHIYDNKISKTLDLATLDAEHQYLGALTFVLDNLEQSITSNLFDGLYIENLSIPQVGTWLQERGWKIAQDARIYGIYSVSFYRMCI